MKIDFAKKLLLWNRDLNNRSMPWKGEPNPYRIWLSEIILQQTRVEQGTAYYEKFIAAFPTISDLARAPEKEIFKLWEGLGYYSRCRNLITTAKKIASEYEGRFPSTYVEILALPGVGPYTASAIASFAFGLPHAVVDGNVERVLSRYFGITTAVNSAAGKKLFNALAAELLDAQNPAIYNQAMMDFGATVCKPQNPLCPICVQSANCQAFQNGWTSRLPLKIKPPARKKRWFYYFVVSAGRDKVWIRERTGKDIWQHLYEFILWESGKIIPHAKLKQTAFYLEHFGELDFKISHISEVYRQTLTHQSIVAHFIHLDKPILKFPGYTAVSRKKLTEYPFPKLLADYLKVLPSSMSW